jgi:hypothetical protein
MFLAVESFLFQNQRRNSVAEQRQPGIVGPSYNPKYAQDDYPDVQVALSAPRFASPKWLRDQKVRFFWPLHY